MTDERKPAPGEVNPAPGVETPVDNGTLNSPHVAETSGPVSETPSEEEGHSPASPAPAAAPESVRIHELSRAVGDVQSERIRQVLRKGKTYAADDATGWEALAKASAAYMLFAAHPDTNRTPTQWPFPAQNFNKDLPRRDTLVRGLAMGVAALEALDREDELARARKLVEDADRAADDLAKEVSGKAAGKAAKADDKAAGGK